MDKLQEAIHNNTIAKKIPPATRQIFERLLKQDLKFFEAGAVGPNEIFISGTINGKPANLVVSWSGELTF